MILFASGDLPADKTDAVEDKLGVYLFSGNQDGRTYGIFIDVDSGEIIMRLDLENNKPLRNTIEHRSAR
jgi:hypothetical protein